MIDRCPYCDAEVDIGGDHGYGHEEDKRYDQECSSCGKTFVYTTTITVSHDTFRADCLNGAAHQFEKTKTYPPEFARLRCAMCGEERSITP
jgi:ribosomal protein S14